MYSMKHFLLFLVVFGGLGASFAKTPDRVVVKRYEAGESCAHYSSFISVDYPVAGPAATVEPLRRWLEKTLECKGKIDAGENPAKSCVRCMDITVDMFKEEYPDITEGDLGEGFDSTCVELVSQTENTVTYQVKRYLLNNGAAHGSYDTPIYVFWKGRLLEFADIFAVDSASAIKRVQELARTSPSNQGECRAHWGEIKEIHWLYPTREGLAFQWHTYAVNNGACGNVVLKLPYRNFKGMLKPGLDPLLHEIAK